MAEISTLKATDSNKEYIVEDWLSLHQLSHAQVKHLLCFAHKYPPIPHMENVQVDQIAEEIWKLVAEALIDYWPENESLINKVLNSTETKFNSDTSTPFTVDNGVNLAPLVEINYQHSPADALHVAHEFGHALQITCSQSTFTPPIQRELAALLVEKIFLQYVQNENINLANLLWSVWRCTYLGTDLHEVKQTLENPQTPYRYRWNYPVAHILLETLIPASSKMELWSFIEGSVSIEESINKCTNNFRLKLNNYLPPYVISDEEPASISAYRALGMAALLDLESWQGLAEESINSYYKQILHCLQNNALLVVSNTQHQACGYATWKNDSNNTILITHQSAPFGDHLALHKQLQTHLPSIKQANAYHPSSANKEQLAWQR